MKLSTKTRAYKLQQTINEGETVFALNIIFIFTATIIAIVMYVQYRMLLNACEDEDEDEAKRYGDNINLCAIFGVLWSVAKIMLVAYGLYTLH